MEAVDQESRKLSLSLAALSRAEEEEAAQLKAYLEKSSQDASRSLGTLGEVFQAKLGRKSKD